jgi:hypothetical protein
MAIAEFIFIPNQENEGELRYSFTEQIGVAPVSQPPKLGAKTMGEVEMPDSGKCPLPQPPIMKESRCKDAAPIGGLFHSGLSLFSNLFRFFPPALEGVGVRSTGIRLECNQPLKKLQFRTSYPPSHKCSSQSFSCPLLYNPFVRLFHTTEAELKRIRVV